MKGKLFLFLALFTGLLCIFSFSVCAISGVSSNEFGEVTEITGIETQLNDKTSRVVLINGDGTYTTYYTYYIAQTLQWQGTSQYDFSALNQKTGESYTMNSIVRIEIMTDTTVINQNGGKFQDLTNFVEMVFPKGTQITSLPGQLFKGSSIQKIEIPKTITSMGTNLFENCQSLIDVTFEEGFSMTELPRQMFNGCKALETIKIPESVTKMGGSMFVNCSSLKEVYLSPNLITLESSAFAMTPQNFSIYAPATFLENVSIGAGQFSWVGHEPKAVTLFITGDMSVAEKLVNNATHNGVKNAFLYDWDPSKDDSFYHTVEGEEHWNIVYNYSVCNAFYDGEHIEGEATVYDTFLEKGYHAVGCTRRGCVFGNTTILEPIFKSYGYSVRSYGDYAISQGFFVNKSALDTYNNLVTPEKQISDYGALASNGKITETAFENGVAKKGVKNYSFKDKVQSGFVITVGGLNSYQNTKLYLLAYIKIGNEYIYISNGAQNNTLFGLVSYADLKE